VVLSSLAGLLMPEQEPAESLAVGTEALQMAPAAAKAAALAHPLHLFDEAV